jgi:hypothetical protein
MLACRILIRTVLQDYEMRSTETQLPVLFSYRLCTLYTTGFGHRFTMGTQGWGWGSEMRRCGLRTSYADERETGWVGSMKTGPESIFNGSMAQGNPRYQGLYGGWM